MFDLFFPYYALKDTRYCANYEFGDIKVKVWYGTGHFEISDKNELFAPGHGAIYLDSGFHISESSLCIVQDDQEDWKEQSSIMLSIYNEAYLTIAADHSENGEGGCFASSKAKTFRATQIQLLDKFPSSQKAFIEWDGEHGLLHLVHNYFIDPNRFAIPLSNLSARGWIFKKGCYLDE
ncbi:hypothetical protein BDZ45DRAFT_812183 [Acephala macrosclerotiorum]|nr:hypothetical protein BDZ45DRAFT_812183 [Acephala macrosclerotiorum]